MIRNDDEYTYALGERAKFQMALESERSQPTNPFYPELLKGRLAGLQVEIDRYEATLKKSSHQMSFDERTTGFEPLKK